MKVDVTGGAGKIGRWVVRELISDSSGSAPHEVPVFDRAKRTDEVGVRFLSGDILDLGQVFGALAGAEAVIHLAGIPTHSVAPNEDTFRINAMGTFNVHEAAWRLGIRRVVTASSEAVLGWAPDTMVREFAPEYLPIDEDHPFGAQEAYGLSKIACEAIARSYTAKCGMETVVLRPPWVLSPEELASLGETSGVTPTRFALFHYVDTRDLADAFRLTIERPLDGCHVLFTGSGESTVDEPLCSLYPRLMPAIGNKACGLTGFRSSVSNERARKVLGWVPKRSWRQSR